MTIKQAQELDRRISESNDTLYIAYTTECCKTQSAMVWLDREHGNNDDEAANDDYYTTSITAEDLHRKIGKMLHCGLYYRRIGLQLMEQLDELVAQ